MVARRRIDGARVIDPGLLLRAYCAGFFPMAGDATGEIGWYSPDPRAIIDLEGFHVPRRLQRTVRAGRFEVRVDTAFEAVIRACAERDQTWISEEIIESYRQLFALGFAHSVESWSGGELAGGLYGVAVAGAFFGESMFSRRTDASKVALVALIERLKAAGIVLLDTQFSTPHLSGFGAREIPRGEYLQRLASALAVNARFA